LYKAVSNNQVDTAKFLIELGVEPELTEDTGENHYAVAQSYEYMAQYAIETGDKDTSVRALKMAAQYYQSALQIYSDTLNNYGGLYVKPSAFKSAFYFQQSDSNLSKTDMLSAVELQQFVSANNNSQDKMYNNESLANIKYQTNQMVNKANLAVSRTEGSLKCVETEPNMLAVPQCVGQLKITENDTPKEPAR